MSDSTTEGGSPAPLGGRSPGEVAGDKKQRINAIGSVVLDAILPTAAPVWFEDGKGILRNATCTLLRLGDRFLGVTCDHVLKEVGDSPLFIAAEEIPLGCVIDRCHRHDLAVLDLSEHYRAIEARGRRFQEPARWPPEDICGDDVLAFCGYPGKWRERPRENHLEFYAFGHGMTGVDSLSPEQVATQLNLKKCTYILDLGKSDGDLGGLSGGPVFAYRTLSIELVGFIYEVQRSMEIVLARRANLIGLDGRILAEPAPS